MTSTLLNKNDINDLKGKMGELRISGIVSYDSNVLNMILESKMDENDLITSFNKKILKNKTSVSALFNLAEKATKKNNRIKMSFRSLDELNNFKSANNCGSDWYDYTTEIYHTYKY